MGSLRLGDEMLSPVISGELHVWFALAASFIILHRSRAHPPVPTTLFSGPRATYAPSASSAASKSAWAPVAGSLWRKTVSLPSKQTAPPCRTAWLCFGGNQGFHLRSTSPRSLPPSLRKRSLCVRDDKSSKRLER